MPRIEFFFDLSSPWTYLAFTNIQSILKETGVEATWRPFLVGGVFNAVNPAVYQAREQMDSPRMRLSWVWLKEWAKLAGVNMAFPSPHHPVRSVAAMRFCCALEQQPERLFDFSRASFKAYFGEQRNLDDPKVLVAIADEIGLDGQALAAQAVSDAVKARLRTNTNEAIERGAFGSPTIFVDQHRMYFGNDQLPLVRQALING